jgi:hypothetical protein
MHDNPFSRYYHLGQNGFTGMMWQTNCVRAADTILFSGRIPHHLIFQLPQYVNYYPAITKANSRIAFKP